MTILLTIADVIVLVTVVISVSRAVWKGQSSALLSAFISLAMPIFALVSLSAASGLAESSSSSSQGILLVFLVAIAIVAGSSWTKNPAQ